MGTVAEIVMVMVVVTGVVVETGLGDDNIAYPVVMATTTIW